MPAAVGWRALEGLRRRKSKAQGGRRRRRIGVPENPTSEGRAGGEELQLSDSSSRGQIKQPSQVASWGLRVASWGKAGNKPCILQTINV